MAEGNKSLEKKPWLDMGERSLAGVHAALWRIANAEIGRSCTGPRPITNQLGTPDLIHGLAELSAGAHTLGVLGEKAEAISRKMLLGTPLEDYELDIVNQLREFGKNLEQQEQQSES